MHSYLLEVELREGALRGTAVTTRTRSDGEFFHLQIEDGSVREIRADHISKIVVLSEHRHFDEWIFGAEN